MDKKINFMILIIIDKLYTCAEYKVIVVPEKLYIEEGANAIFRCIFDDNEDDENFIMSWTFRSNWFNSTAQTLPQNVIEYGENDIISINSVKQNHSGNYTCIVHSKNGKDIGSATLDVTREITIYQIHYY